MFGGTGFRLDPQMPAHAYQTYSISAPLRTHWTRATCAEVDCPHYTGGWKTSVDESTDLGAKQAHYIRHDASRRHVESREGALTVFTFEAGQKCFAHQRHIRQRGLDPICTVTGGDWRGNPLGIAPRRHSSLDSWMDDFRTHQEHLNNIIGG